MAKPPPGMPKPSAEEVKKMGKYFRERDAVVAEWFPKLIVALKAKGLDPKGLKYTDSTGTVHTLSGFGKAGSVSMTFTHADGPTVKIRIDDAMRLKPKDKWRFSDKPMSVTVVEDGKSESLDLERK